MSARPYQYRWTKWIFLPNRWRNALFFQYIIRIGHRWRNYTVPNALNFGLEIDCNEISFVQNYLFIPRSISVDFLNFQQPHHWCVTILRHIHANRKASEEDWEVEWNICHIDYDYGYSNLCDKIDMPTIKLTSYFSDYDRVTIFPRTIWNFSLIVPVLSASKWVARVLALWCSKNLLEIRSNRLLMGADICLRSVKS